MARSKEIKTISKTIYLPPMPDPKKVREGIIEIINLVQTRELNDRTKKLGKKEED